MYVKIDTKYIDKMFKNFEQKKVDKFIKNSINDLLFASRKFAVENPKGMSDEFQIRSKGLVRKHVRVEKAFGHVGYFGSISSARFSGWQEQQIGTKTKRDIKIHRKNARGPGGRKVLQKKYRRSSDSENLLNTKKVKNFTGSYQQMMAANMSRLRREKYSGSITIPTPFGRLKPGIYKMLKSGKIKQMEIWGVSQPEKNPWATDILRKFFGTSEPSKIVYDNFRKVFLK